MRSRLQGFWEALRTSFWFVPSLMAVAAMALSVATVAFDRAWVGRQFAHSMGWVWSGGADGARTLLSTVASSMITVAGTVFSITIAALTLASSQFGPRLLRNFTRDTGNQIVLGTFVATFLYCLLVLRTVRNQSEGGFVPYLSVTCGVLFAAASLAVLIYFIHHVSSAIQAENLIATVGRELNADIARLYPERPEGAETREREPPFAVPPGDPALVHAPATGYVQTINRDALLKAAEQNELLIRVLVRAGDFVSGGDRLAEVWGPGNGLEDDFAVRLGRAFAFGARRTPIQDVRYGVRQLTEIATRALSPGINDPFTAIGCADWLGDALTGMHGREIPGAVQRGENGRPCLLLQPTGFAEMVELSFGPLRAYGADSTMVVTHLLHVLTRIAAQLDNRDSLETVRQAAETVAVAGRRHAPTDSDSARIQLELDRVRTATARLAGTPQFRRTGR